jgi:flagellar assembly protein FliH
VPEPEPEPEPEPPEMEEVPLEEVQPLTLEELESIRQEAYNEGFATGERRFPQHHAQGAPGSRSGAGGKLASLER